MSANLTSQQWRLKERPDGLLTKANFDWVENTLPDLNEGDVLVRTLYLSLDPTNRIWTSDIDQYMPPVELGEVMRGGTLGVVEASRNEAFPVGTKVQGFWGWQSHEVLPGAFGLTPLPDLGGAVPLTAFLSVIGLTGLTAYFGLLDCGNPKEGETVVVSAAAGAVGSIVGQIAKIKGCHVVGIAGSDDKCKWITDELGFDAAINYKTEDVGAQLDATCPNGIDVYFENVGGTITEAVIDRLNNFSRIAMCGLISSYNDEGASAAPSNYAQFLMRRVTLKGFILTDYLDRFEEGAAQLGQWIMEGKLKWAVDVVPGLENAPDALAKLFDGSNTGKLIIQVSDEN
ncbi:MAG: NADP-dependent oxidoreductase [Alphaproteobacteria bacterium]